MNAGGAMTAPFCEVCGRPEGEERHGACTRRRELEPPRYCAHCARRMVVQVTPAGWTARCSAHGAAGRNPELV